jgi:hypothetical protein
MTDHERHNIADVDHYDPQLQWVIDEVIFYITQQKHSDPVWFDVYETITGSTADEAWDEYQATLRAEAEGEARYDAESSSS